MFCPKCGTEYRKGFTVCADCEVSLVSELPTTLLVEPEQKPEYVGYIPHNFVPDNFAFLMAVNSSAEVILAKGWLEGAGIEVYITSSDIGAVTGSLDAPLSGYAIYVNSKDAHLAKELIKTLNWNHNEIRRNGLTEGTKKYLFSGRICLLMLSACCFLLANLPIKPGETDMQIALLSLAGIFFLALIFTFLPRREKKQKTI